MKNLSLLLLVFLAIFTFCSNPKSEKAKINLPYSKADLEKQIDGKQVKMLTLENKNGMLVNLISYGAKIVSVYVPDRNSNFADVVLGFKTLEEYQKNSGSHGAVVGPFANRIANAQFVIDGVTYQLPVNNGKNCIHSGPQSWYRKVWDAEQKDNSVIFTLQSADGEFGFPGNKTAKVTYTLTNENELKINYEITTDKDCHINVTNHAYFNLRGEGNGDVLNHEMVINAEKATPVDSFMIPTGDIADIRGTELDFTTPHKIGERIDLPNQQLQIAAGYDFNYIINKNTGEMAFAASAFEPESGRFMEVFTIEPGVQFYSGNNLKGTDPGKSGKLYEKRSGFCLETQHFPDSPNKPQFPSTLLKAGDVYTSATVYKFSVRNGK